MKQKQVKLLLKQLQKRRLKSLLLKLQQKKHLQKHNKRFEHCSEPFRGSFFIGV